MAPPIPRRVPVRAGGGRAWRRLLFAVVALFPGVAAAAPCTEVAFETLALGPPIVYEGDVVVATPPELGGLDEVINSRERGLVALLWDSVAGRGAVFRVERMFTPTPAVDAAIRAREGRTIDDGCGAQVPFAPLRPGRWAFRRNEGEGALNGADLLVAPGRDLVEVRVSIEGRDLRAVYPITCARFERDPSPTCAASETSAKPLDALLATPVEVTYGPTWEEKERRLKIQAGVSWAFVGLSVLSTAPTLWSYAECRRGGCFENPIPFINLPLSGALLVVSIIPAAIYTARLGAHRRTPRTGARVVPLVDGLGVRF